MHRLVTTAAGTPSNLFQRPTPRPYSLHRSGGWTPRGGVILITPDAALVGTYGARCTSTASGQNFGAYIQDNADLGYYGMSAGSVFSACLQVRSNFGGTVQLAARFQQGSTILSNVFGTSVTSGVSKLENVTVPTGTDNWFFFTQSLSTATGQTVDLDGLNMVLGTTAPSVPSAGSAIPAPGAQVTSRASSARPVNPSGLLTWSPPTLTSPVTVNIDDTLATRSLSFSDSQDVILVLPNTPLTDFSQSSNLDALIQVWGGHHIVCIGGHIRVSPPLTATLQGNLDQYATFIPVDSTAGFPTSGVIRLDGEDISYAGVTPTAFTGVTRNSGFFNSGGYSSLTHVNGATVYNGEQTRAALSFKNQTGITHLEGIFIENEGDGVRHQNDLSHTQMGTLRLQNMRIGVARQYDMVYATDVHPDCMQMVGSPHDLQVDQCSFISRNGRGLLNFGSTESSTLVNADIRNSEFIGYTPEYVPISDADAATAFSVTNSWIITPSGGTPSDTYYRAAVDGLFQHAYLSQIVDEIKPANSVGIGYSTPGYLS